MRRIEVKGELTSGEKRDIAALLDHATRVDGRQALSDHLFLDFQAGGGDGFAALLCRDEADQVLAYGQLSRGNDALVFEFVVHPDHRGHADVIGADLVDAALERVARTGGGAISWWVAQPTTVHRALARDAGMSQTRKLYEMRRRLPTERHATVVTRAFQPGADEQTWLEVNNRAFAAHGEQGGWTLDTLGQRMREPWFDVEGFRIHERDGRMAGFCWTKVHQGDGSDPGTDVGEIYVIAVDPDFRGLGLGSELTLAGLDHLAASGIEHALLYVDADNEAGVATYRRLGFDVAATNTAFTAQIDAEHRHVTTTGARP